MKKTWRAFTFIAFKFIAMKCDQFSSVNIKIVVNGHSQRLMVMSAKKIRQWPKQMVIDRNTDSIVLHAPFLDACKSDEKEG